MIGRVNISNKIIKNTTNGYKPGDILTNDKYDVTKFKQLSLINSIKYSNESNIENIDDYDVFDDDSVLVYSQKNKSINTINLYDKTSDVKKIDGLKKVKFNSKLGKVAMYYDNNIGVSYYDDLEPMYEYKVSTNIIDFDMKEDFSMYIITSSTSNSTHLTVHHKNVQNTVSEYDIIGNYNKIFASTGNDIMLSNDREILILNSSMEPRARIDIGVDNELYGIYRYGKTHIFITKKYIYGTTLLYISKWTCTNIGKSVHKNAIQNNMLYIIISNDVIKLIDLETGKLTDILYSENDIENNILLLNLENDVTLIRSSDVSEYDITLSEIKLK